MAERYTACFRLPGEMYAPGWPVTVRGGALYWDGLNRRYVAQLKLQSVDRRPIKSVKAVLQPLDRADAPLGESVTYLYAAPKGGRDRCFGERAAVPLTGRLEGEIPSAARPAGFAVAVTEVLFRNGERWQGGGEPSPLPPARKLADALPDKELARQFRLRYGQKAEYLPAMAADLWRCACGALNREDEATCHRCGASMADLFAADLTVLAEQRDDRLDYKRRRKEAAEHRQALRDTEKSARLSVILTNIIRAAVLVIVLAALAWGWFGFGQPRLQYRQAEELIGQGEYEQAAERFAGLGDFKDSAERAERAAHEAPLYAQATELLEQREYNKAYEILEEIGRDDVIADSRIQRAQEALDSADEETALALLEGLDDPRARELLEQMGVVIDQPEAQEDDLPKTVLPEDLKPDDSVTFGAWEQDGNAENGPEAITWVVLQKESGYVELISLHALAARPYDESGKTSWSECSLRTWLNGEFFSTAFTDEQQRGIKDTVNDIFLTTDKVYLLRSDNEKTLSVSVGLRKCVPTDAAIGEGCNVDSDGCCSWWLAGSSQNNKIAVTVNTRGKVVYTLGGLNSTTVGVRPVIQVKIG